MRRQIGHRALAGAGVLLALAPVGVRADAERICPAIQGGQSALHVAPFIAHVSADHAVVRWVDAASTSEGLVGPSGRLVHERVQAVPDGDGWVHTAMVLLPGPELVELSVQCGVWSGHTVRVTPGPGPATPLTFVAMGDNRSNDVDHALVAAAVGAVHADVLVTTGDMVVTGLAEHWTRFFEIERRLLARTPLFATFGNHEALDRPGLFDVLFTCPRPGPKGTRSCVRDYGALRVVQLDTEAGPDAQAAWLKGVLAEPAPQGSQRVEIIAMHRPVYTFSLHPPDLRWRAALHPIARDADVEVVFQGHNHTYERFEVDGVTYVTTGGGGAPRYPAEFAIRPEEAHLRKAGLSVLHFVVGAVAAGRIDFDVIEAGPGTLIDRFRVE